MQLVEQQGVVGPVAAFLERFAPQHNLVLPLRERRQLTTLSNLWLKDELDRLTKGLSRAGLGHLVLKGIPLIERLYGSLAERPCADIDLLCRLVDFPRVIKALRDLGYDSRIPSSVNLHYLAKAREGIEFSSASGATLDLHFETPSYFEFAPLAGLSDPYLGQATLSDLNLFALLCDHGSKHMWHRVIWLLDLALLLNSSQELNPADLSRHFRKHGYDKVLKFTLGLMADYAILPPAYLALMDQPILTRQRAFILARHARITSSPEILPRNFSLHLAIIDGFSKKLLYILARSFHPNANDFKLQPQGNIWSSFYWGIRLVNLVSYRVSRFFGPINRWLFYTNTTTS